MFRTKRNIWNISPKLVQETFSYYQKLLAKASEVILRNLNLNNINCPSWNKTENKSMILGFYKFASTKQWIQVGSLGYFQNTDTKMKPLSLNLLVHSFSCIYLILQKLDKKTAYLACNSSVRSFPDTWKVCGYSSLWVSIIFIPSMPTLVRTENFDPTRLNLGTQYSNMLLNWGKRNKCMGLHYCSVLQKHW